ncbi:Ulp1 protease family, carboxy-terminal domain protein [Medicago truncatula]|uniref:Ulp1 protease family, carboxy-terminal domain protein n=1 Tax=Medicago truncatula TaxID=3880 RepID=A0A072UNK0_MEDTR|nr:Ulp1 protease family, carboxy-terminal domain protein [Medicago truncatula]
MIQSKHLQPPVSCRDSPCKGFNNSPSSRDESEDDKEKNYDSTASTPKVVRKVVHKVAELERKGPKSNFTVDIGTNFAPPNVKTKIEGKRKMNDLELTRMIGYVDVVAAFEIPTQYALGWRHTPHEVRKIFPKDFMPKQGQSITKIFIPVNDQGVHWYLMVVDIIERKLVLLDSLPCVERNYLRRREVLKLVCIDDDFFHDKAKSLTTPTFFL